jgi:hypothetical protein
MSSLLSNSNRQTGFHSKAFPTCLSVLVYLHSARKEFFRGPKKIPKESSEELLNALLIAQISKEDYTDLSDFPMHFVSV